MSETLRRFRSKFKVRKGPCKKTVRIWIKKFKSEGTLNGYRRVNSPKKVRTPEKIEGVRRAITISFSPKAGIDSWSFKDHDVKDSAQ